jgi:hypothetical protein
MEYIKRRTTRKTGNYVRFFVFAALLTVFFVSCEKLDNGNDQRDFLVGEWNCKENSQQFGEQSFVAKISKSLTDTTQILVDNFYGVGYTVKVKVNDLNLTIPSQTVNSSQIAGYGTISSNYKTINWTYTVTDGGQTDHVTATYTPK